MSEAIDYSAMEVQRAAQIQQEFQKNLVQNVGNTYRGVNSLRSGILRFVVDGQYEQAQSELIRYMDMKKSYPSFRVRAEPLIKHSIDVISSVKAKRTIPGFETLPPAKQQEIYDRIEDHFEELKHYLKKIEIIDVEVRIEDLRSTVWVVKSVFYSVAAILTVAFMEEFTGTILESFMAVVNEYSAELFNYLF